MNVNLKGHNIINYLQISWLGHLIWTIHVYNNTRGEHKKLGILWENDLTTANGK